jgi:uncharacterized phage protein gp47/JayE
MYESKDFQSILQLMLGAVPADVDQRQGSIIYDTLAIVAAQLALVYPDLEARLNQTFADAAVGDYLQRRAAEFGVTPFMASAATRKGLFYNSANAAIDIPVGSRFSLGSLTYTVTAKIAVGQFELQCETAGAAGNRDFGVMLPIGYIDGLARAELADVLVPGEDDEETESFRQRFFREVRSPATSGNKSHYVKWAGEVPGVGGAQVIPLWNGDGTVKVVIIDSNKQPASSELVQDVQTYIDPVPGQGEGQAPVGASVTVVAAAAVNVDVAATVALDGSRTQEQVLASFSDAMTSYLSGIAFAADSSVKFAQVGSILLGTSGVRDWSDLTINGGTSNVVVSPGSVAVKGTVNLS